MRYLPRLLLVLVILAGIGVAERRIVGPNGAPAPIATPETALSVPAGVPLPGFAAGFSVFIGEEANDASYPAEIAALLDRLATLHVNSVALVYSLFQDGPTGSEVTSDRGKTPTDDGLTLFIRAAHRRGMSVTLRPTLDETNLLSVDVWRGQIAPANIDRWFQSYGALMTHYAALAQSDGVAAFSVGVEFESLEQYTDRWRQVIADVRAVYGGAVTYSFNFKVQDLGFVDALDFVSLDAYYPLDVSTGASVDEINAAWQPWIPVMKALANTTGKPIMLAEIGIRSQTNDFREPWKGHDQEKPNQGDQANYFTSTCNVISNAKPGDSGATIRAAAAADAPVLAQVDAASLVRLAGTPVTVGGPSWQAVRVPGGEGTGFVPTNELTGRAIFMGAYVWFATIGSLSYDASKNQDYPVFGKLAEPIVADCFAQRTGVTAP